MSLMEDSTDFEVRLRTLVRSKPVRTTKGPLAAAGPTAF